MSIPSICGLVALTMLGMVSSSSQGLKPTTHALALSSADNEFGFDLLRKLHKNGENTFLSPTSLGMALQMTSRGASGATLAEMQRAMHVANLDVAVANRELIPALTTRNAVTLNIANSVWLDPTRVVLDTPFASSVGADFHGELIARDFTDPGTVDAVNKWVSDKTAGKIPKMLTALEPDAIAVLINAIYFKGEWTRKFDPAKTKDADFHLVGGETRRVPMMLDAADYRYAETRDLQVVALPFGKDEAVEMWVVLPGPDSSLDAFVRALDQSAWDALRQQAMSRPGTIRLPRFKMRFKATLNETLRALGISIAFTEDADFSRFGRSTRGSIYISRVLHEAVIEVNEEGAEAAAATGVSAIAASVPPPPFTMICDRPFLLMITDRATGSNIFAGTVYKPE